MKNSRSRFMYFNMQEMSMDSKLQISVSSFWRIILLVFFFLFKWANIIGGTTTAWIKLSTKMIKRDMKEVENCNFTFFFFFLPKCMMMTVTCVLLFIIIQMCYYYVVNENAHVN